MGSSGVEWPSVSLLVSCIFASSIALYSYHRSSRSYLLGSLWAFLSCTLAVRGRSNISGLVPTVIKPGRRRDVRGASCSVLGIHNLVLPPPCRLAVLPQSIMDSKFLHRTEVHFLWTTLVG